ncbi:MAG: metallophosphoesterase [Gemmatimonadaceae bacterium]
MRVGLLADSHDRVPALAEFARRFSEAGVELVLHAGDYCSPFSLRPLADASLPFAGIFGRNDGDRQGLTAEAMKGVGAELYESPHSVEVSGSRILLVHDITDVQERSLEAHKVVLHGHSHRTEVVTRGESLLVNPGEACGWLYGVPTAAILDLETREVEFMRLEGPEWCR